MQNAADINVGSPSTVIIVQEAAGLPLVSPNFAIMSGGKRQSVRENNIDIGDS